MLLNFRSARGVGVCGWVGAQGTPVVLKIWNAQCHSKPTAVGAVSVLVQLTFTLYLSMPVPRYFAHTR